jgi:NAD(P)-dependent dehydrogenase (short-subunit alcohol dehydrogenase family)
MTVLKLFRLDQKVALVTGGAGIYGTHICRALAEAGAKVIVAARKLERCEGLATDLRTEGLDAIAASLDLASGDSISNVRDWISSNFGRLDILVNNAVARAGGDLGTVSEDEWESAMRVNSTGLFLACKTFAELMVAQRSGVIINIASIYGVVGPDFDIYEGTELTNPANYSFAKGGMINFSRYMASYYGRFGIRVNTISPGGFRTADQPNRFVEQYSRRTLLKRMATDDDIKGAIVFLASDASAYVTGQNLLVDGGWTAI